MIISRRRFASNAGFSILQVVISGLILFFLYRYLLMHIGAEQLGLWSVILASTSIARLSDLGLTGGVVKFVARYRARNENQNAAGVVETTAIAIAVVMASLLLISYPLLVMLLGWAIPPQSVKLAAVILPWAILAFWINSIAGVFAAALDGCQQAGIRNIFLIFGNIFFFVCALTFVPRYGLIAMAISQVAQGAILALVNWIVLRKFLPELAQIPCTWSSTLFREIFKYSFNLQITSVAILLCDPITKIMMSNFGGLSATAFYDMANQMTTKVRAILVSANQVIVPVIAEVHESNPSKLRNIYIKSYDLTFFTATPLYASMFLLLPLISQVWIGRFEPAFMIFAAISIIANFINNLEVPAHFDNMGTGDLRWNTVAHVAMAALNIFFGVLLGYLFGPTGVAFGAAIAIVLASLIVILTVNDKYQIRLSDLLPKQYRFCAALAWTGCVGCTVYIVANGSSISVILIETVISLIFIFGLYLFLLRKDLYVADILRFIQIKIIK